MTHILVANETKIYGKTFMVGHGVEKYINICCIYKGDSIVNIFVRLLLVTYTSTNRFLLPFAINGKLNNILMGAYTQNVILG